MTELVGVTPPCHLAAVFGFLGYIGIRVGQNDNIEPGPAALGAITGRALVARVGAKLDLCDAVDKVGLERLRLEPQLGSNIARITRHRDGLG